MLFIFIRIRGMMVKTLRRLNMITQIQTYFLLFIIYSMMGWMMEVMISLVNLKKFVNRGFLVGPYCPIYGFGAILITFLLHKYLEDPFTLFIMAILLCGVLEYLTSYGMEKIFHLRWWDYSKKKFNINGRVCLDTIIPFGLLGMMIMYITNPFFLDKFTLLSPNVLSMIAYVTFGIFAIDNIVSLITIFGIKKTTAVVSKENREDNTAEITAKVREILLEKPKAFTEKRIFEAYPKLQTIRIKVKEKIEQTREEIDQRIDKTKELIDDTIDKTKEELNKKIKTRDNTSKKG